MNRLRTIVPVYLIFSLCGSTGKCALELEGEEKWKNPDLRKLKSEKEGCYTHKHKIYGKLV